MRRRNSLAFVAVAVIASCHGCQQSLPPTPGTNPEPASSTIGWSIRSVTGLADCTYSNGEAAGRRTMLETLGGGMALMDWDRDGLQDLVIPRGGQLQPEGEVITGHATAFLQQLAAWEFREVPSYVGRAPDANLFSHGAFAADHDEDGFMDVLVTGYGGVALWRNLGDGTFENIAPHLHPHESQWSTGAAWGDWNADGVLDFYVAHYCDWSYANHPVCQVNNPTRREVCPPRQFRGLDDSLYLGDGSGSYRLASKECGLLPGGRGLSVLSADLDDDRDLDLYVANDEEFNFLYLNRGDGVFVESAAIGGVAGDHAGRANGSMGIALADFHGDRELDLWVTNFERENNVLYKALAPGQFVPASREAGVMAVGQLYVGWGTVAEDFDADGDIDLAVANGHVQHFPSGGHREQTPLLLTNDGRGRFTRHEAPPNDLFSKPLPGRGLLAADLDRDADLDLLVSVQNNGPVLFAENLRKRSKPQVYFTLVGRTGTRNPIGAIVLVEHAGGSQVRQVTSGGTYLSSSDSPIAMTSGSPDGRIALRIRWPGGLEDEYQLDCATIHWILIEGRRAIPR